MARDDTGSDSLAAMTQQTQGSRPALERAHLQALIAELSPAALHALYEFVCAWIDTLDGPRPRS